MEGALKLAAFIDVGINDFWIMTPYELNVYAEAYSSKEKAKNKELLYHAYLISRWVWAKKLDIKSILDIKEEKKVMTDKEMLEQARALNRLLGGKEIICNP